MRNILILFVMSVFLGGCATPMNMAVNKNTATVETGSSATILLATTMKNDNKINSDPKPFILYMRNPANKSKVDRFNFIMDEDGEIKNGSETVYLYRGSLVPGTYYIKSISGRVRKGLLFGTAVLPIFQTVNLEKPGIYYLGRIDGVIHKRSNDKEFRAGPPIPLIDQSATGISNGTWDVRIYDNSVSDLKLVRATYPALRAVEIDNKILPPFDKKMIQKKWDDNTYEY